MAAWSKLPLMLSLLPCSDYVIHVDGDAILANHTLNFGPWLAHMQAKNIDMLLSSDCISESPINFGMFAVRGCLKGGCEPPLDFGMFAVRGYCHGEECT